MQKKTDEMSESWEIQHVKRTGKNWTILMCKEKQSRMQKLTYHGLTQAMVKEQQHRMNSDNDNSNDNNIPRRRAQSSSRMIKKL